MPSTDADYTKQASSSGEEKGNKKKRGGKIPNLLNETTQIFIKIRRHFLQKFAQRSSSSGW